MPEDRIDDRILEVGFQMAVNNIGISTSNSDVVTKAYVDRVATGLTIHRYDNHPNPPDEGDCYFDDHRNAMMVYDGTRWCTLSSSDEYRHTLEKDIISTPIHTVGERVKFWNPWIGGDGYGTIESVITDEDIYIKYILSDLNYIGPSNVTGFTVVVYQHDILNTDLDREIDK